ncbi:MAG: hypothetical protein HC913_22275 [Microscillaceae bacterium]|nr:hypothetical protein [Microscillaceae bacterium]
MHKKPGGCGLRVNASNTSPNPWLSFPMNQWAIILVFISRGIFLRGYEETLSLSIFFNLNQGIFSGKIEKTFIGEVSQGFAKYKNALVLFL